MIKLREALMKFFLIFCAVMGLCVNAFAQLHAVDGDSLEN